MTQSTPESVTEADRKAAWKHAPKCYLNDESGETFKRWMAGAYDEAAPVIKDFARHRQATAPDAALVEALRPFANASKASRENCRRLGCGEPHDNNAMLLGISYGDIRRAERAFAFALATVSEQAPPA